MIIQFWNREKESKELEDAINNDKFEFIIIYGRRRIGKTELILHSSANKKRFYYLAVGENNLERFYNKCIEFDSKASSLKQDWEVMLNFLKDTAEVVIIDEFQNMISEDKNILNMLQVVVDSIFKNSKIKLFLLGSSISIMSSQVLSYKSPLYGRRTGSIDLKAIPFRCFKEVFPKFDVKQLVEIFGFADGIPFYLKKIDKPFWFWLSEELSKEKGFIRDEIDFLLRYEFDDPNTYKLILEAIANGNTKLNEIKDFLKVKRTDITPYLKNLIRINLIKRIVPITEKIKSRFGRYYITDNFIKFWFKYVYPNLSSIEEGIFDVNLIKTNYDSYLGIVFEDVVKQFLIQKKVLNFNKIGKWWFKDKEIDIVALNDQEKEILFCECKWKENVDAEEILEQLKEKSKNVIWHNSSRKEKYCIVSKSFKKKANCLCYDLKDISI